jgi:ABC-type sugar transport system substrate-binding protein
MTFKRIPFAGMLLAALALTFGVAACGSSSDSSSGSGSSSGGKSEKKIGLVQIDLSNPFHVGEVQGAKEAARRHGFQLEVRSGDGDVQKQVRAFEGLVNQKVDAIAVNAIDIAAFGPAFQKARQAHIPVVSLHSPSDLATAELGFSEYDTAHQVGEYAAQLLKKRNGGQVKGKVAVLQGLLGQGLNTQRTGGFVDALKQYPGVQIVAKEPTNWDPQKASSVTQNLLTAHPDLDMIYGLSDSLTVPAATVVKRAGKQKQVMIVSVDGTKDGLDAVKAGTLESTFLYDPYYSGYWKAWFPWRAAEGQQLAKESNMSGVLVTKKNVDTVAKLVSDSQGDMSKFPFEKPLPDIYKQYEAGA